MFKFIEKTNNKDME